MRFHKVYQSRCLEVTEPKRWKHDRSQKPFRIFTAVPTALLTRFLITRGQEVIKKVNLIF